MKNHPRPVNNHKAYHAHIYFDKDTFTYATQLCQDLKNKFGSTIQVGVIHQQLVGPHPKWSCQITFSSSQFSEFIPWLDEQRKGLTVLVHGLSGNHLKDHTDNAYWLGNSVKLNLSIFDTST